MPTDNANVLTLVQAIGKFAQYLSEDGSTLSTDSRHELIRNAEKLAIAAREPDENLYFQATQTAENAAIRTAIAMGVFEKVPSSGSGISATDLSTTLELDRDLLVRIMRACTSAHLFHEVSALHYTHNPLSSIFLEPPNRDMFKQMYDFVGQSVYNLPYFLKLTGYQNPTDYNDSAFQYGHRTNLGFWEYLKEDPERSKVFNSGMQSLATIGGAARSGGPYPFDKELENEEVSETDVVIVDVGGGRGQALEAIKVAFPELRGRMVLQDVENVIEDAKAGGLPDFIEPMVASFLELQPVKGALVYHFRRIFHDWSDDVSITILQNTIEAMDSRSRILITDTIIPEKGAPRNVALQDINMMSFGGMERTQDQWKKLLMGAGLRNVKYWTRDGNLQNVIEAKL